MREIYLFRHAESEANVNTDYICGRSNHIELTDRGVEQAGELGDWIKDNLDLETVEHVATSPAVRARKTMCHSIGAWIMAEDTEIKTDDRLQELDQGDYTGQRRIKIYGNPKTLLKVKQEGFDYTPPNGESLRTGGARGVEALLENAPHEDGNIALLFAHGLLTRCIWAELQGFEKAGFTPYDVTQRWQTPNCSVARFRMNENGEITGVRFGIPTISE